MSPKPNRGPRTRTRDRSSYPIDRILRPFQQFVSLEASGGIPLLVCAAAALAWANSTWGGSYEKLWQQTVTIGLPGLLLSKPLLLWINDGLMAIFFFVVGLEIKREVLVGELASMRAAAFPLVAAVGGMVVPAALYAALNAAGEGAAGWGVPMATDIAFALGILSILGKRVPTTLKIFLTALAIVDDIGAVLVIAIFYTSGIEWPALGWGTMFLVLLVMMNRAGVRGPLPYALLGACMWVAFLKSGVHATVAGVLLAMTIPSWERINSRQFLEQARDTLDRFASSGGSDRQGVLSEDQQAAVLALERACEKVETPLHRFEHALHPWTTFFIMPVFALANAGVTLEGSLADAFSHPITLGVMLGLVVGKQAGIALFAWIAVRLGLAGLPDGLSWRHVYGAAWLGGIGFTMSLFIAGLALGEAQLLAFAKVGTLGASLVSAIGGLLILRTTSSPAAGKKREAGAVQDTAERLD